MQRHLPTQKQLENEAARDISDAYSNLSNICARHPMSHTRPVAEYTVRASYFEKKKGNLRFHPDYSIGLIKIRHNSRSSPTRIKSGVSPTRSICSPRIPPKSTPWIHQCRAPSLTQQLPPVVGNTTSLSLRSSDVQVPNVSRWHPRSGRGNTTVHRRSAVDPSSAKIPLIPRLVTVRSSIFRNVLNAPKTPPMLCRQVPESWPSVQPRVLRSLGQGFGGRVKEFRVKTPELEVPVSARGDDEFDTATAFAVLLVAGRRSMEDGWIHAAERS